MNRSITVAVVALGLALVGLLIYNNGGDRRSWIGYYEGEGMRVNSGAGLNTGDTAINKVKVELRPDGTFLLEETGIPKEGVWRVEDGKALLKIKTVLGRPIEDRGDGAVKMNEELELKRIDKDTITYFDPVWDEEPLQLRRTQRLL